MPSKSHLTLQKPMWVWFVPEEQFQRLLRAVPLQSKPCNRICHGYVVFQGKERYSRNQVEVESKQMIMRIFSNYFLSYTTCYTVKWYCIGSVSRWNRSQLRWGNRNHTSTCPAPTHPPTQSHPVAGWGLCGTQQAQPEALRASVQGAISARLGPRVPPLLVEILLRRTFGCWSPCFSWCPTAAVIPLASWMDLPDCGSAGPVWVGGLSRPCSRQVWFAVVSLPALGSSPRQAPWCGRVPVQDGGSGGRVPRALPLAGFLLMTFCFVQ